MKAYTPELMNIFAGGQVNHENRNVWTYVDASDPNKVYYPYQSTGLTLFSDMGEWYIASQTPEISPWTNQPDNMARSITA